MTRGLKSVQCEVPKSVQKRSKYKKKEELNIAYPVEKTSELTLPVVFGLPGSPSAAVHPGN